MKSTSHTGAAGELFVSQFFLSQGLEVFRNLAASGPADLFVWNTENGKSIPVDVKSFRSPYVKADGSYSLGIQPKILDTGVVIVTYVHGEPTVRLPEGFWELLGMNP